jgi:hypothetical protein
MAEHLDADEVPQLREVRLGELQLLGGGGKGQEAEQDDEDAHGILRESGGGRAPIPAVAGWLKAIIDGNLACLLAASISQTRYT